MVIGETHDHTQNVRREFERKRLFTTTDKMLLLKISLTSSFEVSAKRGRLTRIEDDMC